MASDYNADLIAELYSTTNADEATRISDEMVSVGDAIFPRQIYEAYKRFKNTSVSHYFVSDLTSFKTPDTIEILKEIAHTTEREGDVSMMLEYLTAIEYFDPFVVERVRLKFENEISQANIYEYNIEKYFNYLEKSGQDVEKLESFLVNCFENDRQSLNARKIALRKLLKLNPTKYINQYYENYNDLKSNKKAEVIFVEEISTWRGGIVPLLHEKILSSGSERAKELLKEVQLKKAEENKTKEVKEQKEVKAEYETADVLNDIATLRSKLNKLGIADERFGFPFFSMSEEVYQQGKPAKDKVTMIGYCMVLRSMMGGFDDRIVNFNIAEERASELIPDIGEYKGSINKFHLLLLEKGISVDSSIFGLRNINRIITKFAAHTNEESSPELIKLLKEENLFALYKEDEWSKFHREILIKYKGFLEKLVDAISHN